MDERCEVCDRAECGVSTAAARTASVTIPVTPGENGCDCYGVFARGHNPARGCPVHGAPTYSSDIEAAWSAEKDARADCRAHAIDWRKRALEAEAKLATPAEGGVLTVGQALMLPEVRDGSKWLEWLPSPQHETHQIRVAGDDIYIRWTFHDTAGAIAWGRWRMQGVSLTDLDAHCALVAGGDS
jgi:hypothetical protein